MSTHHPPQSSVPLAVVTHAGIISGTCHVPDSLGLISHLNQPEEMLKLTEARLPGSAHIHPFLAVVKAGIILVVPVATARLRRVDGGGTVRERRHVTCLMLRGSVMGALDVPETVRTSDYLLRTPGFVDLYHCSIDPDTWSGAPVGGDGTLPIVLVNTRLLVGITESA